MANSVQIPTEVVYTEIHINILQKGRNPPPPGVASIL